jgi:hypothetical protein
LIRGAWGNVCGLSEKDKRFTTPTVALAEGRTLRQHEVGTQPRRKPSNSNKESGIAAALFAFILAFDPQPLTIELILKIGRMMAIAMKPTTPPIAMIMMGSIIPVTALMASRNDLA